VGNRHGDLTLKRGFDAAYFAVSGSRSSRSTSPDSTVIIFMLVTVSPQARNCCQNPPAKMAARGSITKGVVLDNRERARPACFRSGLPMRRRDADARDLRRNDESVGDGQAATIRLMAFPSTSRRHASPGACRTDFQTRVEIVRRRLMSALAGQVVAGRMARLPA
jgi:hypothetical protein